MKPKTPSAEAACTGPDCCGGIARRDFLQIAGLSVAAAVASSWTAMAGPLDRADFDGLVPADKKLSPEWVRALFERGQPTVYRGTELDKIGMPIGGICTGQLYLGGDGKLWHWDVFNKPLATNEAHYAQPPVPSSPLAQGFALRIKSGEKSETRPLDRTGFAEVTFRGEYPLGFVDYRDDASPVAVSLEAFSPFIPLDPNDSNLPATVLRFTVRNTSEIPVECDVAGWLENAVCLHTAVAGEGLRRSRRHREDGILVLEHSAKAAPAQAETKEATPLEKRHDFGTLALALLATDETDAAVLSLPANDLAKAIFSVDGSDANESKAASDATRPFGKRLIGAVKRTLAIEPGKSATVTFVVAWHFPNLRVDPVPNSRGRFYATRFASAGAVVEYVGKNFDRLDRGTHLWHETWYNSTLPYWFLDRTFANTSILASSSCHWFDDGRFYGWEGVGCCPGTCTHVWHYAQAVARLFPQLERDLRERTDFGLAFNPDSGVVRFRAEGAGLAIDGQAGCILRSYREHQMSADDAFLRQNWPKIRRALECLIEQDSNSDGLIEGRQHNTLDTDWFGPVAWLSGLYQAALRAGEAMAREIGDADFASRAGQIAERGSNNIVKRLWEGEYFVNRPDPQHLDAVNSGSGCEIDQVLGQGWAFQLGLGRVLPEDKTRTALRSLWRYNFTPDVGPYREAYKAGRWYAMPGEAGLLMCTFPRTDWDFDQAKGASAGSWAAGYFNECMNGFEYQVAGHMLWEGLVMEGLAVTRTVHDRYHAARRNPWNEVECGDHYARSMASYGVFLAACGFEYHGPHGHLGFDPRLTPEDFRAAFTAAEGWGTFSQKRERGQQHSTIDLKWGALQLRTLSLVLPDTLKAGVVRVSVDGQPVASAHALLGNRLTVTLAEPASLRAGQKMQIVMD